MPESVTLRAPQEMFAVLEKAIRIADVDPVWILLAEKRRCGARCRVGNKQVEPILNSVKPLDGEALATGQPIDAGQQETTRLAQVHPSRRPARRGDHTKVDIGIWIARFGITLRLEPGAGVQQIDLRKDRLPADVELEVSDATRIGRPPVRRA